MGVLNFSTDRVAGMLRVTIWYSQGASAANPVGLAVTRNYRLFERLRKRLETMPLSLMAAELDGIDGVARLVREVIRQVEAEG